MTEAWLTAPKTWAIGELATQALMLSEFRDRFDWLKNPPAAEVDIGAAVSLTLTTYADICTLPSITPVGKPGVQNPRLLFTFGGMASLSTAIGVGILCLDITEDGVSVAGGTGAWQVSSIGAGLFVNVSFALVVPNRSPAAHVYKLRGKISAGGASIYGSGAGFLGRFGVREI